MQACARHRFQSSQRELRNCRRAGGRRAEFLSVVLRRQHRAHVNHGVGRVLKAVSLYATATIAATRSASAVERRGRRRSAAPPPPARSLWHHCRRTTARRSSERMAASLSWRPSRKPPFPVVSFDSTFSFSTDFRFFQQRSSFDHPEMLFPRALAIVACGVMFAPSSCGADTGRGMAFDEALLFAFPDLCGLQFE